MDFNYVQHTAEGWGHGEGEDFLLMAGELIA